LNKNKKILPPILAASPQKKDLKKNTKLDETTHSIRSKDQSSFYSKRESNYITGSAYINSS